MAVVCIAVSCQKHAYDFTFSPTSPKAGQKVSFTNTSDAGESWVWKFGDGGQSTMKNPTHTYTSAGTYVVELMADSNRSRVITHVLEVLDSIPSVYVDSDTVRQYVPVTLKASLYNPLKQNVTYNWELDEAIFTLTQGTLTSDSIIGYFTDFGRTAEVKLTITVGDKTTVATRTLTLIDNPAPSLLMLTADGQSFRQRIYEGIYEAAKPYDGDQSVFNKANDSTATLNGVTYDKRNMPVLSDKTVKALQVDAVNRKLYVILDDGLYVANANGDNLAQITGNAAVTLLIDAERNRLYWCDADGVWAMPLVTNPQNILSEEQLSKIRSVNEVKGVNKMIIDN